MIESLGETTVGYLKPSGLDSLHIFGDEATGTARVIVGLHKDGWDERRLALERLVEVRLMFLDELALEFCFADDEAVPAEASAVAFSFA